MKALFKFVFLALTVAVFLSGCSCGGGGSDDAVISLVAIEVAPAEQSIVLGTNQQFTATGVYSDNTRKDITNEATWASSDTTVATVSDAAGTKGLAAAILEGSSFITASLGGKIGSATLTVTPATLVSIQVTPASASLSVGKTQQYTATGTYSDNTTKDITASATWSITPQSVAVISNDAVNKGLLTAFSAGTASVTAELDSITGSAALTVTGPVLVSITVLPSNPTVGFDTYIQFTAIGYYSNVFTMDITNIATWSSSNTAVATISNEPGTKGLAKTDHIRGKSVITATLGDISGFTTLFDP